MARRRGNRMSAEANKVEIQLTPMIDAVFLLLIFFMTTTVFKQATQLKIDLPDAVNYDRLKQEKKLNVRISSDGELEMNGQIVRMDDLGSTLMREKSISGSATLIITADAGTPHGFVIDAMEIATRVGVEKLDVETQDPGSG
ncbi:MAG: biopolymer transporter ExbD [Candidatus Latescibacterota bacterium]|nr:biopolymer transporter ExbD [Candidatus Latescibacterota bacterium]